MMKYFIILIYLVAIIGFTPEISADNEAASGIKEKSSYKVRREIKALMKQLRNGDEKAIDKLVAYGPAAYNALKNEWVNGANGTSEWFALRALTRLKDKRVILALSQSQTTVGQYNAIVAEYFDKVMGKDHVTLRKKDIKKWYEANKDRLVWDSGKKCYTIKGNETLKNPVETKEGKYAVIIDAIAMLEERLKTERFYHERKLIRTRLGDLYFVRGYKEDEDGTKKVKYYEKAKEYYSGGTSFREKEMGKSLAEWLRMYSRRSKYVGEDSQRIRRSDDLLMATDPSWQKRLLKNLTDIHSDYMEPNYLVPRPMVSVRLKSSARVIDEGDDLGLLVTIKNEMPFGVSTGVNDQRFTMKIIILKEDRTPLFDKANKLQSHYPHGPQINLNKGESCRIRKLFFADSEDWDGPGMLPPGKYFIILRYIPAKQRNASIKHEREVYWEFPSISNAIKLTVRPISEKKQEVLKRVREFMWSSCEYRNKSSWESYTQKYKDMLSLNLDVHLVKRIHWSYVHMMLKNGYDDSAIEALEKLVKMKLTPAEKDLYITKLGELYFFKAYNNSDQDDPMKAGFYSKAKHLFKKVKTARAQYLLSGMEERENVNRKNELKKHSPKKKPRKQKKGWRVS